LPSRADNSPEKETEPVVKRARFVDAAYRHLKYALSLPERTIRSLAALAGGTSMLLAEMVFPEPLRRTITYELTIGLMQRFVIEEVAEMEHGRLEDSPDLAKDYVQRKMAGTALEAAGLLTIGFSPLWVMAIAGDAAAGSKVFLHRLVKHLKANGVMAEDAEAKSVLDVLEAIQDASRRSARALDMPPLSRRELALMAEEMKSSYARVFRNSKTLLPRLEVLWQRMEQSAGRNKVSVEGLSGAMALDASARSRRSLGLARSARRAGSEFIDEQILESYRKTLAAAAEQGIDKYMGAHLRPFVEAAKGHFDPARPTWTESRLKGKSDEMG
jgi:hypothetical protein